MAYSSLASQTENEVLKYHRTDGWTSMKPVRGTQVSYKQSPHFAGSLYKFEYDMDLPDNIVYSVMRPPLTTEERLSWDKSIKHFECLEEVSSDMMIGLIVTHSAAAGMISSREFVDLYYFKENEEIVDQDFDRISWIFAKSVDHAKRPKTRQFVRAWNYPTGYAVHRYRNSPNKCKLTLYINVEIGGMIPRYLVESALPSQQVSYIESVKSQATKVYHK